MHLVELEDLPWVPAAVRNGGTDLLDLFFARIGFYREVVDVFVRALDAAGGRRVVDLCSGGGGGALYMSRALRARDRVDVAFVLTDRHPSDSARERVRDAGGLEYHREPIDASNVPASLPGLRTMFSALHHFRPEEVQRLLAGAVASRTHVAFFDAAASPLLRRVPVALVPLAVVPNALILFLLPFFLVPFVRPARASLWLLTYLLPLVPVLFAWDGTVSALRAYSPEELLALARSVPGGDGYVWESARGGRALYLTGRPAT